MRIHRSISVPPRKNASWEERWSGPDFGLIASWERGREKRAEDPAIASRIQAGELPILPWKGGLDPTKNLKMSQKYGSMFYLAMWQGMRGADLDINTKEEPSLVCTATLIRVIFTSDIAKLEPSSGEGQSQ